MLRLLMPILLLLMSRSPLAAQNTGQLSFKVGIVFKSGDVRPLPRTDFYLLSKSFEQRLEEAAKQANVDLHQSFSSYIDSINASPELKGWLKKNNIQSFSALDGGEKAAGAVTVDDLLTIPEFVEWLKNPATPQFGFIGDRPPKYPKPNSNPRKQDEQMEKYRQELSKRMKEMRLSSSNLSRSQLLPSYWLSDMFRALKLPDYALEVRGRKTKLEPAAEQLAQKYIIAETKTSLTGEAEIPSIPAGEFWLSNVVPSKIGSSFVFWDIPVKVTPGNMTKLELSNDNESYSPLLMQVQELLPTGLQ